MCNAVCNVPTFGGGVRLTPISRLSAAGCVDLELRPLPSTGATRRQRYYGPIRHPGRPGLSLAGVRLRVTRLTTRGFPCCVDLRVQTCRRHYPGGPLGRIARGSAYSNRYPARQRLRPSPPSCRVGVHIGRFEACSTFTRVTACLLAASPKRHMCLEGSDGFVTSTAAPIATGWSDPVAGWELHPRKTNTIRCGAQPGLTPVSRGLGAWSWSIAFGRAGVRPPPAPPWRAGSLPLEISPNGDGWCMVPRPRKSNSTQFVQSSQSPQTASRFGMSPFPPWNVPFST